MGTLSHLNVVCICGAIPLNHKKCQGNPSNGQEFASSAFHLFIRSTHQEWKLTTPFKAGAMISIVTSYEMVGKELAGKADKILKGQSPSQVPSSILPLEQQTILVNAKTVEALGIELPYDILSVAKLVE